MFVSSKASAALGLSVGVAMSIHNLTEGFMIALPLYYATRSRTTAFTYAAIMGGFSQPLGAFIGLFLVKTISSQSESLLFGVVFGCVSGMMSLITIQVCDLLLLIRSTFLFFITKTLSEHRACCHKQSGLILTKIMYSFFSFWEYSWLGFPLYLKRSNKRFLL